MDERDAFVPAEFEPPDGLDHSAFSIRPLTVRFNERDFLAWSTSIDHIRSTPGFERRGWPRPMSLDDNRADLERHAADFEARRGFTYTVLDPEERDVIGCVYIYPASEPMSASVRSWVRASHAHLDGTLAAAVRQWLSDRWPFRTIEYANRPKEEYTAAGKRSTSTPKQSH